MSLADDFYSLGPAEQLAWYADRTRSLIRHLEHSPTPGAPQHAQRLRRDLLTTSAWYARRYGAGPEAGH